MSLSVTVKSASSLPNVERFSKSDPMCVITYQGQKKKTKVIDNNLDPEWNETLEWPLEAAPSPSESIKVAVYDHETIGKNKLLGTLDLSLREVIQKGRQNVNSALKSKKGEIMQSKILLELSYTAPAGAGGGGDGGDGGGGGGGGDEDEDETPIAGGGGGDEDGGDGDGGGGGGGDGGGEGGGEGAEGGDVGGGSGVAISGLAGGEKSHSTRRRSRARAKLPNKPLDFQIRVHILEARKLLGGQLNPVVRVACGSQIKETSTQKGTVNPFFDEMVFFNFNERPSELFDKVVEIKVLNAKKLIRDALIGSFKFDVGLVYDESEHCFIHKWLLLTDPNDPAGGAKGYLKFSINVIGPGDDPKPSPSTASPESADIEANLLRPSGVRLQPGTLFVKIYRGEDMPQMDPGYFEGVKKILHVGTVQKELVDPYCVVTFAGHKGKTPVIWNEQDPEWNHQINLGVRFPSMCERIRFQIKDKDKLGKDDFVGTTFINMSQISAPGEEGFLPTYGPCFVNIYGSPREFTDLPDKFDYLNKGLIEGVAYRGRVMVELDMELGKLPEERHREILPADQKKIMPFLRRRKYKLYAAFFSATLVQPVDAAAEFEISIGNYGNKLDDNTPASSSTTPASNPVYDGNAYYFLPWMDQKPCVVVDSQWEDCTYRIDSLNILIYTADKLEEGVLHARKMMEIENYEVEAVKSRLGEVLDEFIENLDEPLPPLPKQGFTRLDKLMRERRTQEWVSMQKEAEHLRMAPHTIEAIVDELEEYVSRLRVLAVEPQNSVPDVIIWMLSGNKRVAVHRIPSHLLMHSPKAKACGKLCKKIQTIFLLPPAVKKEEDLKEQKGGAQVRVLLWLGLEQYRTEWATGSGGKTGEVAVFAETYENEACLFGRWGTTAVTRPNWSDSRGKIRQPKEAFEPTPDGWRWEGDWFKCPELSIAFEPDEGLDEWAEDIFENQIHLPFAGWPSGDRSFWTDVRGDKLVEYEGKEEREISRDDLKCPEGWLWKTDWKLDKNRAVDEDGWEYSVEAGLGAWVPYERNIHLCRRRRWVRIRVRDKDSKVLEKKKKKRMKAMEEGWEYARLANLTYHITEHRLDFARRRRWLRKLVAIDAGKPAIFRFKGKKEKKKKDDEDEDGLKQQVPRMYFTFKDCHTYQLRSYIYQARDLYGSDSTGLSDPYAIMAFGRYSTRSRVVKESVCPTWDQTLMIKHIRLFGDPMSILESSPLVYLDFFDKDTVGEDEFLGKAVLTPTVRLTLDTPSPRLDWYEITRYEKYAGELLGAFELLLDEGGEMPFTPPTASPPHTHYIVPSGIRPILQKTRIEVLCWGVRDMKRFQLLKVDSPLVELECGGTVVRTRHIKNASKNPNFPEPIVTFDVYLPKEELYAPPLNLRILDKRSFGRHPMVGTHIIKSLKSFHVDPQPSDLHLVAVQAAVKASTPTPSVQEATFGLPEPAVVPIEDSEALDTDPDNVKAPDFDWWSKYYYSIEDERRTQKEYVEEGHDKLVVYHGPLEEEFNNFTDLAQTFPLYRGKGSRDPEELAGQSVGLFKGTVKVYPLPDDGSPEPPRVLTNIPSTNPIEVVVRVYIIRAMDLQPQDPGGKSDPYLKVKIGKNKISDKDNYIPNNLNPLFGKMFELPAILPLDHTLKVTVMDWDRISADDLIGYTTIDLENRFLSQHRATCGLPETFSKRGPNKWRDMELPVQLLEDFCRFRHYPAPEWSPDKRQVIIDGNTYTLDQFEQGKVLHPDLGDVEQRLALHILRQQDFVPEHIERRTLESPMQPGISQGAVHMWVDMFTKDGNIPNPVNIEPRKPEKYTLRIVVWNTSDVILDEKSIITGEAMSDIYVKSWIRGQDDTQKTDVHYRSLDGEGNFNWRFVFPFEYIPSEKVMVIRKKEHFYSLSKTETHLPPKLTLQVWDNDIFSPDDFIGTVDIDLHAMPEPVNKASECDLKQLPEEGVEGEEGREVTLVDLFKKKRMKGWWPCYYNEEGVRELAGKLELELEVVTEEEEQLRPAAKSRDDPNMNPMLDPPNRPATSFLWFTSPWKTFKFIIWRTYKWWIIGILIAIVVLIIVAIFIYTSPGAFSNWIVNTVLPG